MFAFLNSSFAGNKVVYHSSSYTTTLDSLLQLARLSTRLLT